MSDSVESSRGLNMKYWLLAVIAVAVLAAGSLWLVFGLDTERQLMPMLYSPTPPTYSLQKEPETISFTELNDNPLAYLNQSILVTGDYLPADKTDCSKIVGPDIRWSLTADNLQLDVVGFERIVRLLPVGTTMTVQGIWRLYQGPLGCGKGPPRGSMWYLDAKKIIQPNPLVGEGGQILPVEIKNGTQELPSIILTNPAAGGSTATILETAVTVTDDDTGMASPIVPGQPIPTQTPGLPGGIKPSATVPQSPTIVVPTNTPDPNATVPTATGSATAVPTDNPGSGTPTLTPETPPLPPTSTRTDGGGYPGPGPDTPTPTATLVSYP